MSHGRGRRRGLVLLAVVAVVTLVWLALGPDDDAAFAPRDREVTEAPGSSGGDSGPGGPVGSPIERDGAEVLEPIADTDADTAAEVAAEARPAGVPARFDGRVVDLGGRPVPGARVIWHPDGWTLEARDLPLVPGRLDPADTVETLTDDAGRFVLDVHHEPARPGEPHPDRYMNPLRFPEVLVMAEGFAAAAHVCRGFQRGDWSTGDIVLRPAAVVTGLVVDDLGTPLSGVTVDASRFSFRVEWSTASDDVGQKGHPRVFLRTVTGSDGRFLFGGLDEGAGAFLLSRPGRVETTTERIQLAAAETRDLGTLVLSGGGSISGVVHDAEGLPLAGATVFTRPGGRSSADMGSDTILHLVGNATERPDLPVTDEAGRFRIEGLDGVNFTVLAARTGYEPGRTDDVAPGATGVVVRLTRQATLRLTVVDGVTGEPVPSARVEAFRAGGVAHWKDPALEVVAGDEPGTFLVARPGRVATRLVVAADGWATLRTSTAGIEAPGVREHTVSLSPEAVLAGTVVGPDGAPLSRASVSLTVGSIDPGDANAPDPLVQLTATDGRFRFVGLPALDGRIGVSASPFAPLEDEPVVLAAGERREDLILTLGLGGGVSGVIRLPDGSPAAGGSAALWRRATEGPDPFASFHVLSADAEGRFELLGLVPGDYHVQCDPGAAFDVHVAADEIAELVIQQRDDPRLTGRITDHLGAPLARVRVKAVWTVLRDGAERQLSSNTRHSDERGDYVLEVNSPGNVDVVATAPGGSRVSRPARLDWNRHEIVDIAFPGGRITGRIMDDDGRPLPGARVLVGREPVSVPAGEDGRFVVNHLAPGEHVLSAGLQGYRGATATVSLGAGTDVEDLRLVLEGEYGARLSGTVLTPSGVPVADGTYVNLLRPGGGLAGRTDLLGGAFAFEGIDPGDYELVVGNVAQAEHFGSEAWIHWRGELTLSRGEVRELEIVTED